METQVLEQKIEETIADDIFVLVLVPKLPAFSGITKPYEELYVCGRSLEHWLDDAIAGYPSKRIAVSEKNDILSLVRENSGDYKYVMVIYADTPLLRPSTVESAASFIKTFNNMACRLPRGWVFNSEYIRTNNKIEAVTVPDLAADDFYAVYNYGRLAHGEKMMRLRINEEHLENGVYIVDPSTAYIDADVQIERGVTIEPNVTIQGRTTIKQGTRIGKGCTISSCTINASQLVGTEVADGSVIGPFAHLREGTKIGENCRIGNFVEIKNSTIGDNTKIAHLSYVGDAVVGKNCNIGCGVVFCNYDGKDKHKFVVGDNVFIGSNVNLVAPIKLANNSFIAAGSTLTKDVPTETVAIARVREETHKPRKPKLELIIDDEPEEEKPVKPTSKQKQESNQDSETEIKIETNTKTKPIQDDDNNEQEIEITVDEEELKVETSENTEDDIKAIEISVETNDVDHIHEADEIILENEIEITDSDSIPDEILSISASGVSIKTKVEVINSIPEDISPTTKEDIEVVTETIPTPPPEPEQEEQEEEIETEPYLTNDYDDEDEGNEFTEITLDSSVQFDWDNAGDDVDPFYQGRE